MPWIDPSAQRFDRPLDVEDLPEFHAARLLLLMRICGEGRTGLIRGRTKLAKLDFFVRYPGFLEAAVDRLRQGKPELPTYQAGSEGVEASMVRYRYGPWDHRYYNLLGLLDGRGLVRIGGGHVETYSLTPEGRGLADHFLEQDVFHSLADRCRIAATAFAGMTGTNLKDFVYETFVDEVVAIAQGKVIPAPETTRQ